MPGWCSPMHNDPDWWRDHSSPHAMRLLAEEKAREAAAHRTHADALEADAHWLQTQAAEIEFEQRWVEANA